MEREVLFGIIQHRKETVISSALIGEIETIWEDKIVPQPAYQQVRGENENINWVLVMQLQKNRGAMS